MNNMNKMDYVSFNAETWDNINESLFRLQIILSI